MSRYIDADKTLAFISRLLGGLPLVLLNECEKNGIDIVRCKECKYKRIYDGETKYYYCALEDRPNRQWSIDEMDYCSWAEREGE